MEEPIDDAERTRPPLIGDLVDLCRELNQRGATYIVVGGMAINIHGFARNTKQTYREKDEIDRSFLRKLLEDRGEWPVE